MVKIDNLANEIARTLKEYTEDVSKAIEIENKNIADEAVKELKNNSPKKTGKYAKGWTKKKENNSYIIYNKNKPQLTHLLEKGHAKQNGGRVSGKPHIGPVENTVIQKFQKVVEQIIRKGGK